MASIKATPNTILAIKKAYNLPVLANSRRAVRVPSQGGGGSFSGLWVPSFTTKEGENVQTVKMTACYYGRGNLSILASTNPGTGPTDPPYMEGSMPGGVKAYIGFKLHLKLLTVDVITGANFSDVSDAYYNSENMVIKTPLYYVERGSTTAPWAVVLPLYLMPRLPLRV